MSKLILVSFADSRFRNSLLRVEKQTEGFPFDERHFLTQYNCLTPSYWRKLKPWLYRRGFGFWSWKASIVKEYLKQMEDGDMLFWSDAGLYWNNDSTAIERFNSYISILSNKADTGLLVFEQPTVEQEWTKGDVFEALGVYNDDSICKTNQLWAGCFLIKKTPQIMEFIDQWIDCNRLERDLITDKRSTVPNKSGFREHRHDQSIFSVMVKLQPHVVIPWTEVLPADGDWEKLKESPIQGRRLKEVDRSKKEVLKNKLMRPWREILGFYFKRIRHYEYEGNYVW